MNWSRLIALARAILSPLSCLDGRVTVGVGARTVIGGQTDGSFLSPLSCLDGRVTVGVGARTVIGGQTDGSFRSP